MQARSRTVQASTSARAPDDARHSLLGKARPLSQSGLDAFAEATGRRESLLGRETFGRFEVREVDVKSALTPCAMPGRPWSVNPYLGCSHDCAYCYVPDVAHLERERWGSYVVVKRNLPTVLARELKRKPRGDVFLSSATDAWQPVEREHRITRRVLEQLVRADWPVRALTRNPLIRRDVDLFRKLTDVAVGLTVPTLDDAARRLVEPGAPPIEGRLRTLRDLSDAGIPTFANLMPAYPFTGDVRPDEVAAAFAEAGVGIVYAGAWRYLPSLLPVLRERLDGSAYAAFSEAVQDPRYYTRLLSGLRGAFRRAGVEFRVIYDSPRTSR